MSELTKRILSATLLAALLLVDLWLGSWWFLALLIVGGVLVFREYARLVFAMTPQTLARAVWLIGGVIYIGLALHGLWRVRAVDEGLYLAVWLFFVVWATDVGGYLFGRLIGGPKVAPAISPSKTWAGVIGGIICASVIMFAFRRFSGWPEGAGGVGGVALLSVGLGALFAVLAQAGDFFESWMKRRAGVKDSGSLIPGHGGLFDRIDGLLPVAIIFPWVLGIAQ